MSSNCRECSLRYHGLVELGLGTCTACVSHGLVLPPPPRYEIADELLESVFGEDDL